MAAVGEAKFKFECPGRGLSRVRWDSKGGAACAGRACQRGARGGGGRRAAPLPRAGAGALDARGAVAG